MLIKYQPCILCTKQEQIAKINIALFRNGNTSLLCFDDRKFYTLQQAIIKYGSDYLQPSFIVESMELDIFKSNFYSYCRSNYYNQSLSNAFTSIIFSYV